MAVPRGAAGGSAGDFGSYSKAVNTRPDVSSKDPCGLVKWKIVVS
jgi:hypothetical protein